MRSRIVSLSIFIIIMAGSFIYFLLEGKKPVSVVQDHQTESARLEQRQKDYEDWWSEGGGETLKSRPTYHKLVSVVHVGELNSDVLLGKRFGNVAESDIELDPVSKTIDFSNEDQVPQQDDQLLVIRNANNMDVLLEEEMYRSSGDLVEVTFHPFNQPVETEEADYAFINEARLFEGQSMTIRKADEAGTIEIYFNDKQQNIAPGKTAVFETSSELQGLTVRSKIVVSNYGLWETSDMTYTIQE